MVRLGEEKNQCGYASAGKRASIKEFAKSNGVPYKVVKNRLYDYGWNFDKAISTPVKPRGGAND